jgi:nucleoside-diphosphate-sugar epimerase
MAQRLLITGATGFVGRALAAHFVARGDAVFATYRASHPTVAGVEWLALGSDPVNHLVRVLNDHQISAVIHAAGRINGTPAEVVAANEGHTADLLAAIGRASAGPAFYFLSTVSAIGPTGVYGQSKRKAEDMIAAGAPGRWAALRASLIHGPHDTKNVAALVRAARNWPLIPAPGGSAVKLQPLYVGDLAEAFAALVDGRGPSAAIYTVSGPRQERLVDMIRAIQDRIKRHAPVLPIPLGPVRPLVMLADRLLPFLHLPAQQIRALHGHPMYRSDEAMRELGFTPRLFADSLALYL